MTNHGRCLLAALLLLAGAWVNATPILPRSLLGHTENIVVLPQGRVFLASDRGIYEIKRTLDLDEACEYDAVSGLTACLQVDNHYDNGRCFFSGMTTDGHDLYAACTIWYPWLIPLGRPRTAALYRVTPGASSADQVQIQAFADPVWYNGMTMLDDHTLLLSASSYGTALGFDGPAIAKLTITDPLTLGFELEDWLERRPGMLMPNGLLMAEGELYFIGGQTLFRIPVLDDGSAGEPELLYRTPWYRVLDDMTWHEGELVLAEIAGINGLGKNYLTYFDPLTGHYRRQDSGLIQVSSLAVDLGNVSVPGALLATSFFEGGLHRYDP
ncbi:MAG: hypothetical protein D9N11_16410 [Ketobacter sp.]|nr:MAG: hypothetical protein D9N11_16410 [Ketobacter sp.]